MKVRCTRLLLACSFIACAVLASGCAAAKETAEGAFDPAHEGTLTVATNLPAPGFWRGDTATTVDGGFEWGIAQALADAFDLDLEIVDIPFDDIVTGNLHGADLALAQVSVTSARKDALDFSAPYLDTQPTVVSRAGEDLTDLATAREWTWAVRESTTEVDFVDDVIRPESDAVVTDSESDAIERVRDGDVDAALMDLATALVLTKNVDDVEAIARFDDIEGIAVALPRDSENVETVNKELASLRSDGTLDDLDQRWLEPAFARDPRDLPVITTD